MESIVCMVRECAVHEMKLHPAPFKMIKSGQKTIELRLFDEKRQKIREGDVIIFTNTADGEKLRAAVKKLHRFESFGALYRSLPLLQCGYTAEDVDTAHPSDMEQYYTPEEQKTSAWWVLNCFRLNKSANPICTEYPWIHDQKEPTAEAVGSFR